MSKDNQKMTGDSVYRVKMYKDGKRWVYAGATTLALAAGLVFANVNASADTAASSDATTEQVSSAASSAATSSTATSSAATDASSASSTASSTATSTSSTASSTATTSSSAASSTASSAATSTTSAASSSAATVSATTPASSDATSTSTATVAATAAKASVATPASAAATATTTATTTAATTAPTVTAPASEAANQTAAGSVDAGTLTSATQSGGSGNLQDQAQYIQENVDGTNIKVTAGHTYAVAIRLTKSQALDWANASGQVSIAPNGSNSNGTWTAVEYATESGKEYSYAAGASTATVDITKLTDADSYVTVLYTFKANDDATTGSRAAYLEFTGTTSVNKLSTNTNNTDANQQIEAWSYATQVMDTSVAAGTVVVHYVDENGNKIADDTTVQGDVDNTYTVTPATFSNYTLDTTKSSALTGTVAADTTDSDGNVTAAGTELTLVYSQNTEASNLTVNYVDADGNTILPSKTYTEGADGTAAEVGGAYSVNAASIDGYTLTGDATQTGTFVSGGNTVTFTYTKDAAPVEQSTVTVNYVDADGNTIKAATTQTLDNGSTYTVETPTIAGYTYKSADAALTGTVDGNKTITLTYTKNATPVEQSTVTVNYVDADGNTIKAATTQTLDNGSTYTVETPTIDGYTYKSADAALTGTVDGNKTITLTYTKDSTTPVENKANLTINYVDADGNTIKASNVTEYIVGQAYTVGQPEIAGYSYNHSTGDAIAGTIGYNGNTVTLVYTKNGGTTTAPTTAPTVAPTTAPTVAPTTAPTTAPTVAPTTAPTTAPTVAPTTAPGTGDNVNGGGTGTTTTAPVTTPSDDTVDNGNGSSNNGSSTTTSTAPATTVSDDEVTPTTTATTNNGTSGVVPASASLKPVVTTKTTTSDAKTLPQTDEDENGTALAVLGLSTLLMGSALYFGVSRRKHEA
ncbi:MucBP domain-containing protein [Lactiplantibacillus plantarum]|uniref:MucBP domain-containing protein n=6 Tax=Lactiplantibacillus plantarum TaxID=1590 RepID=UPI00047F3070|nr:MucBP domain-containing protein [Lactiplantibacillus plantarum]AQX94146.1 mucus-binding protein [Lactiplantibacillus plantarum]AWL17094.1 LPXTG cell wall anchor domain-containing protein [Lactiplantibacillus plantarum]AYA81155.1 LPXTG cell wall anchor domain-containing protein [Lactiplantibacillus plantarum]AYC67630.1 LPXTG cell wall anchor domain-containing protein [Lactiplantibacillus plantarum]AYC74042.1 LPXTG cell wall anchor domain-containing protein [Lactiplantibacillus plantarum]